MQKDTYNYISWISNASGMLQFELSTLEGYRNDRIVGDCWHINEAIDSKRVIFVTLLADLRDRFEKDSSIYTRIFLYAKEEEDSQNSSYLAGNFWLIDDVSYPALYKDRAEQKFISKIIKKSKNSLENIKPILENYLSNLAPRYIKREVKFKIYQNGYILLGSDENSEADIKSAYFFIKFLFHKDRFHSRNAENIVPLIKIENSLNFGKIATKIYKSMIAYVAQQRKIDSTPISLSWLDGVLLYTKSFLLISKEYLGEQDYEHKSDGLSILSDAITEELKRKPYRASTIYQFFEDFRLFAFIVTLVLAIYKFFPQYKIEDDKLIHLLPSTPTVTIVVILIFSFLATGIVQVLYNGTIRQSYFSIFQKLWSKGLSFISKHSKPNSTRRLNIFQKYFIPYIVNFEMFIRRNIRWKFKMFIFITFILSIIGFVIYYDYQYFIDYFSK